MKKQAVLLVCFTALLVGTASMLSAQSLLDNEFYKKARILLGQSQDALQAGEYDQAANLAAQARENFAKSDEYVAVMTMYYRANSWLVQATNRVAYAKSIKADTNYKNAYEFAVTETAEARTQLDAKEYESSIDHSKNAMNALVGIAPPAPVAVSKTNQPELPEYYIVRLIPSRRDCFWRIAEYPFVYGDPWKWRLLYEANKSLLENPDNPDLIDVGLRFIIPSLAGEKRSGEFDPQKPYPAIARPH